MDVEFYIPDVVISLFVAIAVIGMFTLSLQFLMARIKSYWLMLFLSAISFVGAYRLWDIFGSTTEQLANNDGFVLLLLAAIAIATGIKHGHRYSQF